MKNLKSITLFIYLAVKLKQDCDNTIKNLKENVNNKPK